MSSMQNDKTINGRKLKYAERLNKYIDQYDSILTIGMSNIGSKKLGEQRKKFRERGIMFLKGKNTLTRKVLELRADSLACAGRARGADEARALARMAEGNIGFVFAPREENLAKLCDEIAADKVVRAAKAGALAPQDVTLKKGPTQQGPATTAIFQASGIATRINRGQVDVLQDVQLARAGEPVSQSAAELLAMLGLKPFRYGLTAQKVFQAGDVFPAAKFGEVRDSIVDAYRNVLALGLGLKGYSWKNLEEVRQLIENHQHAPALVEEESIEDWEGMIGESDEDESSAPQIGFSDSESSDDSDSDSDSDES